MTTEDFKRKLTAILSADVVGYSRLMGEDEAATVKTLESYKGVMSSLIKQHRGRVVDSPGDNLLAEFGSVVDAVQCAVSIQKELQTRNADLLENRRMDFRIGINLGDVIEEQDRIYGDGVNIAARLEALADPGGICVSKTAFDHIESKLPFGYQFIGDQAVKNIAKPIGAYKVLMETRLIDEKEPKAIAPIWKRKIVLSLGVIVILMIAAVLYWNFYPRGQSIEPAIKSEQVTVTQDVKEAPKSIAVLPFDDLSLAKDQEYFVLGLSEEILNSLAQIKDLTVIAKTSSFSFKGKDKTIQEIASVLGADHVLEGSVRKAGNAIRITAQLIKTADESHLWSKTYDKELKIEEMFSIQEDIATSVADELKVTFGIGKPNKQLGMTSNLEAYEYYLVAKGLKSSDIVMTRQALEAIDAAIDLDSRFALAWAEKSSIHLRLVGFGPSNDSLVQQDMALNAAMKAIELEPNLAEAYDSLGLVKRARGDWIGAELAYSKARELTTMLTDADFPWFIITVGHFERASKILGVARQIDPLNQRFRMLHILTIGLLGDNKRVDEEIEYVKALFKDQWGPRSYMNMYYRNIWLLSLGVDDNISGDEIVWSDTTSDVVKEHLNSPKEGLVELQRIYADKKNLSSSENIYISLWAAYFGDSEFAMNAIEKGVSIHHGGLFFIWYPAMREVRQTPRFREFVKEIGLVNYWKEYGWPDICRPIGDDDFVCD